MKEPKFNQKKWENLESYARNLTKTYESVWICSGPLYLPKTEADDKKYVKYQVIGEHNVAVPTHFFKVLLGQNHNGTYDLSSYIMPNAECTEALESYLVPIDNIEKAAGFLLFDDLLKTKIKSINGKDTNVDTYH